jgi:TolA-binding protein
MINMGLTRAELNFVKHTIPQLNRKVEELNKKIEESNKLKKEELELKREELRLKKIELGVKNENPTIKIPKNEIKEILKTIQIPVTKDNIEKLKGYIKSCEQGLMVVCLKHVQKLARTKKEIIFSKREGVDANDILR